MKSSLHVTALASGASRVLIPDSLLSAMSLRRDDQLYAVMVPCVGRASALSPCATLYATPLPHRSWGRLFRASFTSGPGPGTIARLTQCLQSVNLYPRFIETAETRPLNDAAGAIDLLEAIGPDTTTVLELPRLDTLSSTSPTDGPLLRLHEVLSGARPVDHGCIELFQHELNGVSADPPVPRLESLTPLGAVNHLGELLRRDGPKWYGQMTIETARDARAKACIPCDAWRKVLWPQSRNVVEEASHPHGIPMAVIVSVDTFEHLITLQFYRLDEALVASFDVAVPAAGLEQRWWRWIYDEIASAHGSVLGSRSSGRFQSKWGILSVVAVLPGRRLCPSDGEPPINDIGHAIRCMRGLKGRSHATAEVSPSFQSLRLDIDGDGDEPGRVRREVATHCLGSAGAASQLEQPARMDSTLQNVRLWYSHETPSPSGYEGRFGRNPFSFTKPLHLGHYSELYDRGALRSIESRYRIAERLRDHLVNSPAENVVLVGAYRSGKTSVMNIVVDLINQPETGTGSVSSTIKWPATIAIRVNASVTPPELLFVAVFNEICKLIQSRHAGRLPKFIASGIRTVATMMTRTTQNFLKLEPALEVEFGLPFVERLRLVLGDNDEDKLEAL